MKQDRRLNKGLLMHVKNLRMNYPGTVKVTSKQTAFCSTHYANDILGKLSKGIRLVLCTMSPHLPRRPLTLAKGSDASELGPKNHLYS